MTQRIPRLPGGGPWLVLAGCPGMLHNTARAAMIGPAEGRCICPRGLELKRWAGMPRSRRMKDPMVAADATLLARMRKERPDAFTRQPRRYRVPTTAPGNPASLYMTNTKGGRQPSALERGYCRTPEGMTLVDDIWEAKASKATKEQRFKDQMCANCPLTAARACLSWAMENESPAGAWEGVYGGLSPAERIELIGRQGVAA